MFKSLKQFMHDLRTYVWGVTTNHPNWRETQFGFDSPIAVDHKRHQRGFSIQIWFDLPRIHILNAYEMEVAYLQRRNHA